MTLQEADIESLLGSRPAKLWLRGYTDRMHGRGEPEVHDEYTRGWIAAECVVWGQENNRKCAEMRARLY